MCDVSVLNHSNVLAVRSRTMGDSRMVCNMFRNPDSVSGTDPKAGASVSTPHRVQCELSTPFVNRWINVVTVRRWDGFRKRKYY